MPEARIGRVKKYYSKLGVAVIALTEGPLRLEDMIHLHGSTTDFEQPVESLQIGHEAVEQAETGRRVAVEVLAKDRPHDFVYKVTS